MWKLHFNTFCIELFLGIRSLCHYDQSIDLQIGLVKKTTANTTTTCITNDEVNISWVWMVMSTAQGSNAKILLTINSKVIDHIKQFSTNGMTFTLLLTINILRQIPVLHCPNQSLHLDLFYHFDNAIFLLVNIFNVFHYWQLNWPLLNMSMSCDYWLSNNI